MQKIWAWLSKGEWKHVEKWLRGHPEFTVYRLLKEAVLEKTGFNGGSS